MRILIFSLALFLMAGAVNAQEASPTHAVGGDFNGDGNGDVVVASSNGRIFYLPGLPGGKLDSPQTFLVSGNPEELVMVDFNQDGLQDILCDTGSELALLAGSQETGLQAPKTFPHELGQVVSLTQGDFNGDGLADLALASWSPNQITFFLGKGDGQFEAPRSEKLPVNPFSVAAADLDSDGLDEAYVSLVGNTKVMAVRLGEDKLDTSGRLQFGGPIGYLTSGDFDGDGKDDLGAVGNNKFWLVTRRQEKLAPPVSHSLRHDTILQFVDAGDLDGDGKDELVSTGDGQVVIAPDKALEQSVFGWRSTTADLDGDGKAEILVTHVRHGLLSVIRSAAETPDHATYNIDPNRP